MALGNTWHIWSGMGGGNDSDSQPLGFSNFLLVWLYHRLLKLLILLAIVLLAVLSLVISLPLLVFLPMISLLDTSGASMPAKSPSRKRQIVQEEERRLEAGGGSRPRQRITDPDPDRSLLCGECKNFMAQVHSHPWSDPAQAPKPFGAIGPLKEHSKHRHRRFDLTGKCMLCQMVREIVHLDAVSDFELSRCTYILKPTPFGEVYDGAPSKASDSTSSWRSPDPRWCVGIESRRPVP